jgi:hypothetical protein
LGELTVHHWRRLRRYYRSAGWPCHDNVDLDLLAASFIERTAPDSNGVEAYRVTPQGLGALEAYSQRTRSALDRHQALVDRVAECLVAEGRVVFRGVMLRARPAERWQAMRPDVFSIRNTSHEAHLAPFVHEIKVSRADLLADLKQPAKRAGYQAIAQQCYYVLAEGIAEPDEVPADCGVFIARADRLERLRASPVRATRLATMHWPALAKARAEFGAHPEERQLDLVGDAAASGPQS